MTSHEWMVLGMYAYILMTVGGLGVYGILTSVHRRRYHRHAR